MTHPLSADRADPSDGVDPRDRANGADHAVLERRRLDAADAGWLARAVALGSTARAVTSPNPAVGCVLVADGRIVGEGATRPAGSHHAEAVALAEAGATAAGATAYTTLEPCAHHGRTPPCTAALIEAGVERVVIGHPDPNPAAAGGAATLRAAGLEVVGPLQPGDLFHDTIAQQLEGFLQVVEHGLPLVTLKLAQTTDGHLTAPAGRWVTGAAARSAVHRWRAASDAVLVGSGTVLADDPRLDVRHVRTQVQPRAVILDGRLRMSLDAAVVRPGTIVVTSTGADPVKIARLRDRGVEVEVIATARGSVARGSVAPGSEGSASATGASVMGDDAAAAGVDRASVGVALGPAMRRLARHGINDLFAEPGRQLASALLEADLVDRLVVHIGRHGAGTVVVPAIAPSSATSWRLERMGGAGPDGIVQFVRTRDRRRQDNEEVA